MAQSQSGLSEYERELDQTISGVMPDRWEGHGRLKIAERGFSDKKASFAEGVLEKLKNKHPDTDAEKLAEKAIEVADKKLD